VGPKGVSFNEMGKRDRGGRGAGPVVSKKELRPPAKKAKNFQKKVTRKKKKGGRGRRRGRRKTYPGLRERRQLGEKRGKDGYVGETKRKRADPRGEAESIKAKGKRPDE